MKSILAIALLVSGAAAAQTSATLSACASQPDVQAATVSNSGDTYVFDLARDAQQPEAPDFLSERLRIDVLSAAAPVSRAFALGGARLRLHARSEDGSLRAFKEPHFLGSGQTLDGSFGWSGRDLATSLSVATEHVVQVVGLPGVASFSLSALVADPVSNVFVLTSLPPLTLTLRAPRAGGSCQGVCFDDLSGQQYDDDLQAPRLTVTPALSEGPTTERFQPPKGCLCTMAPVIPLLT